MEEINSNESNGNYNNPINELVGNISNEMNDNSNNFNNSLGDLIGNIMPVITNKINDMDIDSSNPDPESISNLFSAIFGDKKFIESVEKSMSGLSVPGLSVPYVDSVVGKDEIKDELNNRDNNSEECQENNSEECQDVRESIEPEEEDVLEVQI